LVVLRDPSSGRCPPRPTRVCAGGRPAPTRGRRGRRRDGLSKRRQRRPTHRAAKDARGRVRQRRDAPSRSWTRRLRSLTRHIRTRTPRTRSNNTTFSRVRSVVSGASGFLARERREGRDWRTRRASMDVCDARDCLPSHRVVLQRTRGKNASRVALMSAGRARARRAAAISFSTEGKLVRRPPSSDSHPEVRLLLVALTSRRRWS
jgi:hypothetical protein